MNLANKITISRIILIPFMVGFMIISKSSQFKIDVYGIIAAVIFLIAALTDFLDGYIARKKNQITTFGKFLDPIADKVLVISGMIYLVSIDRIFFWTVIIVIFREFLVTGIRLLAVDENKVIAASSYGKIKTILTMVAITIYLFNSFQIGNVKIIYNINFDHIFDVIWYSAIIFTIISGLDYLIKNKKIIFENM